MNTIRPRTTVLALALGLVLLPAAAPAAWLGGITFSHPTPSHLPHGERVYIDIDYQHADAGGVRIFAIPRSGGGNTPGQGNSGSALVPAGTGTATRWFSVYSGAPVVDNVRILMTNADQSVTYFDFTVRVHYMYGPTGVYNIQYSHDPHSILANGEDLTVSFDWGTSEAPGVVVFARPWHAGSLVSGYAASPGNAGGTAGSGSQYFTFPAADTEVGQVHFTVYNQDMTAVLMEFDTAVDYHWRDVGVANFTLSKPSPGSALGGEDIQVTFDYVNPTGDDMLVWTVPWLGTGYAPGGYSSGSAYLPPGTGTATRYFGVNQVGDVDAFRVWARNADQSVHYADIPVPVSFHFDHHAVDNISMVPERPAILDTGTFLGVTFDYHTDHAADILAWALPWFDGGLTLVDFAYAGSPPLPTGSGTVTRSMRGVVDGKVIDHVYFRFADTDQTELLFEFTLPMTAFWAGAAATSATPPPGPAAPAVLGQNYPNPFNPVTTIPVELDATRHVKLTVYDLRGRRVATLVDGLLGGGRHEIPFDGTRLASGQYIYRLEGAGAARTMTLVK